MTEHLRAYNSLWQVRSDSWCRLEEAADRLTRPDTAGKLKEKCLASCQELLGRLSTLEPYWAYPGSPQFARVQRLFTAGSYDKFCQVVAQINRALTQESYRTGDVENAGADELDMFPSDPRQLEGQTEAERERPYFEVLVVEKMTDAQERALRNEVRKWRRPDDEFVYELVVVASGDEALIAARLNVNLQAVVIRRRFSHQSTRDLSSLSEFVDDGVSHELADHYSPEERAQILATSLSKLRPELDLYLMTEIDVEDIAGRLGQYFRRVFHAREGMLELHLSILHGVAARYRTPFFSALKQYSHRPTGVFHALPISQGKSIVNSHWIKDMVGFYGLEVFMAETSATCGGLDSLLEPTGPLRESQQLASKAYGSRHTYFVTNGTSTANKIITQAVVAPGDIVLLDRNCHQSHHYGMMMAGANVVYLEAYPLNDYSMYGAVPLREIKSKLLALKRAGKLDRVKMMSLTNCTFDGIVYDVERVMEECLAIKPDLVFLWDEAWFAFARFHPVYRTRTAMASAAAVRERLQSPEYKAQYEKYLADQNAEKPSDEDLLNRRLTARPGAGAGAGIRLAVDAQDADRAAAGIDDSRLRSGLRPEGRGAVPRGVHGAHLDLAELPDPGVAGPGSSSGGPGGRRVGAAADRERHAAARCDRQPPAAEQVHELPWHVASHPGPVPPDGDRPTAALGSAQHDGGLAGRRVRARPVANHVVHRAYRLRRRHVQARTADGSLRHSDQQDLAQQRVVHDEHRHHAQLGRVPGRGVGQHRRRARSSRSPR